MSAPESYLDERRPSLEDAIRLEGVPIEQAIVILSRKGYFTPPPRPWKVERVEVEKGTNWVVVDRYGDPVVTASNRMTAVFIASAATLANRSNTILQMQLAGHNHDDDQRGGSHD